MTKEEVNEIYNKVYQIIDSYRDYHTWYSVSEEDWWNNGLCVSFNVHGWSDQGEGSEWDEHWSIDGETGKIYGDDIIYESFEDFYSNWN